MAAQSRFLAQLFDGDPTNSWVNTERLEVKESTPSHILYKWDGKSIRSMTNIPFIAHSVQIWSRIHKMMGYIGTLSPETPLWENRLIPILYQNRHFESWPEKGITYLKHVYNKDGIFMSFQQLKQKYNLSDKDFFKYLQLRNFVRISRQNQWEIAKTSPIELLFHDGQPMIKTISKVYETLLPFISISNPEKSRRKWETDLGLEINSE